MKKALSFLFALCFVIQLGLLPSGMAGTQIIASAAAKIAVSSVKLTPASLKLAAGSAYTIKAAVSPANATVKSVSWKSSNTAVAVVSSTGKVTALRAGSATITCTAKDGSGKKAICKATIADPAGKAEIINYFNMTINRVKPKAKAIIQNYERNKAVGGVNVGTNKTLSKWATSLMSANMGEVKAKTNVTSKTLSQKNTNFPVEGQSWSSKLTPGMVTSAVCKKTGGVYIITITIKKDTTVDPTAGGGFAGNAFSVVTKKSIVDNEGGAKIFINNDSIKIQHHDCRVIAKVDAATGHVTHANYYLPLLLSLRALGVDASVGFSVEKDFTIKW